MANTAYAADINIYRTGFENPPFVAGSQLLEVDDWSTAIPPFLNPNAAKITNLVARKGKQSVEVRGADMIPAVEVNPFYDAVGSYRRPANYTVTPTASLIRMDADLMLATSTPKTPGDFACMTIAARSGNGENLGETGICSNGIVEGAVFDAGPADPFAFVKGGVRFNKWYHLTMYLDFKNRTTTYMIDDHFVGSIQAPSTSNVLLRGAMVTYVRPAGDKTDNPSSTKNDYTFRFDNFRISAHSAAPDSD